MITDIHKLFFNEFKVGDNVFILDEDDHLIFGEIEGFDNNKGIKIKKYFYPPYLKWYSWNIIRFISHDGFPVRKLFPRSSDKYLVHLDSSSIVESLRKINVSAVCKDCNNLVEENSQNYGGFEIPGGRYYFCKKCVEKERYSFRGGHPFEIEDVFVSVVNNGNASYYHNYVNDRFLETGILQSKDGLIGLLWDFSTIFEMSKLNKEEF